MRMPKLKPKGQARELSRMKTTENRTFDRDASSSFRRQICADKRTAKNTMEMHGHV